MNEWIVKAWVRDAELEALLNEHPNYEVREMFRKKAQGPEQAAVRPVPPQPIAVVPSGLPLGDVVTRLTELQAQHPDAEVRRGKGSSWELWASEPGGAPPGAP